MIDKINIYNKERQSGKTSILKLKAVDVSLKYYDKVIFSSYNINECKEHERYFDGLYNGNNITINKYKQIDFIRTDLLVANLRGKDYKNILLLIDEPFLNGLEIQDKLLHFLEESNIIFHILGYGTECNNFKQFKDYIK